MPGLLQYITESIKFVDRQKLCEGEPAGFELGVVAQIQKRIEVAKIGVAESNKICTLLKESQLTEEIKANLEKLPVQATKKPGDEVSVGRPQKRQSSVSDLLGLPSPAAAGLVAPAEAGLRKRQLQSHEYLENYFNQEEWDRAAQMLSLGRLSGSALATTACTAMTRCGWFDIDENDYKKVIGIFGILGPGAPVSGNAGLESVRLLKKAMAAARPRRIEHELVQNFPEDPAALPEPWLRFSQRNGPLVKCPADLGLVRLHQSQAPGRSTHWSVKAEGRMTASNSKLAVLNKKGASTPVNIPMLNLTSPANLYQPWQAAHLGMCGGLRMPSPYVQGWPGQFGNPLGHPPFGMQASGLGFSQGHPPPGMHPASLAQPPWRQETGTTIEELTESAAASPNSSRASSPPPGSMPPAAGQVLANTSLVRPPPAAADGSSPEFALSAPPATLASGSFFGMADRRNAAAAKEMGIADVLKTTDVMLDKKQEAGPKAKLKGKANAKAKGKGKGKKKAAAAIEEEDGEDEEDDDEEEDEPPKLPEADPKKKKAAACRVSEATARAPQPLKDPKLLEFKGTKKMKPRKYGCVTIYSDTKNQLWRLKPSPASRHLTHYSWKKEEANKVWRKMIVEVKRLTR